MKLLRVALLTETYPPDLGGLALSSQRLACLLATAGHEVHVFVPSTQRSAAQVTRRCDIGITLHRLSKTSRTDEMLAMWFDYIATCHTATPFDVLHAYFITQAGFVATSAGYYLGVPSVVSARGNDLDRAVFDPRKAAHILYALQHATAITANTHDLVRKAQAFAPGREVQRVANGVDTDFFAPEERILHTGAQAHRPAKESEHVFEWSNQPLTYNEPARLVFVGEARAKKGLAPLLVAYRAIAAQHPAELILVGGVRQGDDAAMITLFRTHNPHLPLRVVAWVEPEAVRAYYWQCTLLLLPSLHDGLPNALLEGMACGCAIIGSAVGGIADVIADGINGILVPPGDANALAHAILRLLNAPELCKKLGMNARDTVLRAYTPAHEFAGYRNLYSQLQARTPRHTKHR